MLSRKATKFLLFFVKANRFATWDDICDHDVTQHSTELFEVQNIKLAQKYCNQYASKLDLIHVPCPEIEIVGFSVQGFEVCREFWPC